MVLNSRCSKCGYNCERIVLNLYKCRNCGYILSHTSSVKRTLVKHDLRKVFLTFESGFTTVQLPIYQLDVLKIYQILYNSGQKRLAQRIKNFVSRIDDIYDEQTDLYRTLPKVDLSAFID